MMHENMLVDMFLHTVTLIVSVFLLTVSYLSYKRKETEKFLYIFSAFGLFAVNELIILTNMAFIKSEVTWINHIITLAILLLFYRGTTR